MKILHLLRTEPDVIVKKFVENLSNPIINFGYKGVIIGNHVLNLLFIIIRFKNFIKKFFIFRVLIPFREFLPKLLL